MKKIIASISLACYFVATIGVSVNFHYCMNRLASIHLFGTKAKQCAVCGMETHGSHGCCRDDVKVARLVQDQVPVAVVKYSIPAIENILPETSSFLVTSFYLNKETNEWNNHSPPLLSAQDTYLQNRVFRI